MNFKKNPHLALVRHCTCVLCLHILHLLDCHLSYNILLMCTVNFLKLLTYLLISSYVLVYLLV